MKEKEFEILTKKSINGDYKSSYKLANHFRSIYNEWSNNLSHKNLTEEEAADLLNKAQKFYKLSIEQGNKKANFDLFFVYANEGNISLSIKCLYTYLINFANKNFNFDLISYPFLIQEKKNKLLEVQLTYDDMKLYMSCINTLISLHSEERHSPFIIWKLLIRLNKSAVEATYKNFVKEFNNYKFESSFGEYFLLTSNYKNALKHLEIGEMNNSALCCELLGDYYCGFYDNNILNYDLAIKYYKKEIKLKHYIGKLNLANVLIKKDMLLYHDKIVKLHKDCLEIDDNSYSYLGDYYILLQEFQLATQYYYIGFTNQNILASIKYAIALRDAIGCEQNIDKSINILERICKMIPESLYSINTEYNYIYAILSEIYFDDKYNKKDENKVLYYSKIGCKFKNIECTYILGKCYLNGYGIKIDKEKGEKLVNKAIKFGFNEKEFIKNRESLGSINTENIGYILTQANIKNQHIKQNKNSFKKYYNSFSKIYYENNNFN